MLNKLLVIISFILLTVEVFPQQRGFGAGIILGEPTGFSLKYSLSENNAFDFALGYSFTQKNNRFHLTIDHLWFNYSLINSSEKLPFFYGIGARIKTHESDDASFGARGVFGLAWFPHNVPIDVFIQAAPVFKFIPGTGVDLDAGIGVRYFFN